MNPPRRGKGTFRDSTRLCRVALPHGLSPHGTALRHCPMLRFAFSATGGAQLRIPVTRISVPMEFKALKHTPKEKTMKLSSHRFFGALSVEGVKKNLPQAIFKGFSENKEMRRFFARCEGMQGKKHRNPLWIPSIFNAADTTSCRKS